MRVLLTNDDGIHARGLRVLADALIAAGHRVTVCAPDRERSAASHSSIIGKPVHPVPVDFPGADRAWATDGTPVDCARVGVFLTRDESVDLVISGINRGMNLGGACVYSGTVGAALEAAMCGAQALAVSLVVDFHRQDEDYGPAARLAIRVAEWIKAHPLPRGCIYNLNLPPLPYDAIKGLVAAPLDPLFVADALYRVEDGGYHYVFAESPLDVPDSDFKRVNDGYATITKLTWDMRLNADDGELNGIGL
ncbi:MAG: 5'/3'-nucleotidase SurE [Clostridia bacterium]|nr:5'/3'-nucleotidase SurE [Clostridia bacterium]